MKRSITHIILAFVVAIVALGVHSALSRTMTSDASDDDPFYQSVMNEHISRISSNLDAIADSINQGCADTLQMLTNVGANDNYSYYIFRRNRLRYWRNAMLPMPDLRPQNIKAPMMRTENGWYYVRSRYVGADLIYVLFRVRSRYPFVNQYLKSAFDDSFGVDEVDQRISTERSTPGIHILDADGRYLFTIVRSKGANNVPAWAMALDFSMLVLWLVAMLVAVQRLVLCVVRRGYKNRALALLFFLLLCVYIWSLSLHVSPSLASWFIFSPQVFAYDEWVPSLVYLCLFSLFAFIWSYNTFRLFDFHFIHRYTWLSHHSRWVFVAMLLLVYAVYFAANTAINILVYNSTDLAIYVGQLDVTLTTVVKIVILSLLMMAFVFVLEKVYSEVVEMLSWRTFLAIITIFSAVVLIPSLYFMVWFEMSFAIGFVIINLLFFALKKWRNDGLRFSSLVWIMAAVSLLLMQRLTELNEDKERQNRDVMTNNLSLSLMREDDPVAEGMLLKLEQSLAKDSVVTDFFAKGGDGDMNLYGYLRDKYFDGYFSRFDLQAVPCYDSESSIQLTNSGVQYNCFDYFQNMVNTFGSRIAPKSHFYCLDDNDGRASYFGQFGYHNRLSGESGRLYIEINVKSRTVGGGYPELLTNSRDRVDTRQLKGYSYALYSDGRLSSVFGDYDYPSGDKWLQDLVSEENSNFSASGYQHTVYVTPSQYVVLSFPEMTVGQYVADYSYLFLSMFLFCVFVLFVADVLTDRHLNGARNISTFTGVTIHERIQMAFITFVMILLVVICLLSGYESISNFDKNSSQHRQQILSSVKRELTGVFDRCRTLEGESQIDIDNVMQNTSTMFSADVHIYSPSGRLLGTSRRELFDNGIVSQLINSEALLRLKDADNEDVYLSERIGNMVHHVAYSPLINGDGFLIGYINVPYFSDVSALESQLLSTLVPITNSYMLVVFLAVLISYFLAREITKPLLVIGNGLRNVGLNKGNAKIDYPDNDEVGQLVGQYNRMLDELASQAEQLALSEREVTWREMARQIAHEIKNPLTPMKLSVQYMMKKWESESANENVSETFDPFIRRVSKTLVEQIDQLSFIASEFSNVAKNKPGDPSNVDVIDRLSGTVLLYSKSENASVVLEGGAEHAIVYINPEQVMSVFNNLIKNALQSVSAGQHVNVRCKAIINGDNVLISVADDGRGIAPEVREKIFKPNFTTKSTGMGLGLAIVKTIIVNANGDIWFDTKVGVGTTFFIRLPLVKE